MEAKASKSLRGELRRGRGEDTLFHWTRRLVNTGGGRRPSPGHGFLTRKASHRWSISLAMRMSATSWYLYRSTLCA